MANGTRRPPWYRQHEALDRARAYSDAFLRLCLLDDEPPQLAQVYSYRVAALTSLIFESNTFESAGLDEDGTRAALAELGAEPAIRRSGRRIIELAHPGDLAHLPPEAPDEGITVRFGGRSRAWREVTQHYLAWHEIVFLAIDHAMELRGATPHERQGSLTLRGFFLSAQVLRALHRVLAEGLIPPDAGVEAGDYRVDDRIAGRATGFVAPDLIGGAMDELERDARGAFARALTGRDAEAYELAARFSHRLVAIHPFPDFNGRLSRLVLSACMEWAGLPFPVSLKFDKRGRERYLFALRRADRGDLRAMTMLVARAVVLGFEEIDARLELTGLSRLLPRS